MPKHDNSVKNWLGKNARFADLFNHVLFQGKPIIKKEELSDIRNESDLIIQDKNKKIKTSTRYRDIVKQWKNDVYNYVSADDSYDEYYNQSLEKDAREYSNKYSSMYIKFIDGLKEN